MITLIGSRCKTGNGFSRGVLISRFLLGNLQIQSRKYLNLNPLRVINHDYATLKLKVWFWWFDAVVTPVPIPNTEVKRCSGDDSPIGAKVASRQNQVFNSHLAHLKRWLFVAFDSSPRPCYY